MSSLLRNLRQTEFQVLMNVRICLTEVIEYHEIKKVYSLYMDEHNTIKHFNKFPDGTNDFIQP